MPSPYAKVGCNQSGIGYNAGVRVKIQPEDSNFYGFGYGGKNNGGFNWGGGIGFSI